MIRLFVSRPVGTILLALACVLAGMIGYLGLPVADLPNIDFPVIQVIAQQPGGSPEQIASAIAEPLERRLGTIAGLEEMTSQSTQGVVRLSLQFALSRDINGAARDVEAAIQAARADLPPTLRQNPQYHKANPNDPPAIMLALTSDNRPLSQVYDQATNQILPRIARIAGVGEVEIAGSALPAVRVEIDPQALYKFGIGLEDVRAALASANAHTPKGNIELGSLRFALATNDQARSAAAYRALVIAYRNARPVRLDDVAQVVDGVEDVRNAGYFGDRPAIVLMVFMQAGGNIIQVLDQLHAQMPYLRAIMPGGVQIHTFMDRSRVIRASLDDTRMTLLLSVMLVVLTVWLFLGTWQATLIPAIVIPVAMVGALGVVRLLGYTLDTMSLTALTIATGFIVDDAIVVVENIARHVAEGLTPGRAAVRGAGEVAFTVLSMTLSLIAVFLPILLMGGVPGRLFHEFAVTVSVALLLSMLLSLSLTPTLCARLRLHHAAGGGRLAARIEGVHRSMLRGYARGLDWALKHRAVMLASLPVTLGLTILIYIHNPRSLFPDEDGGALLGRLLGEQAISFQALDRTMQQALDRLREDPDVAEVAGFIGMRGSANQGNLFIALTDKASRHHPVSTTIANLDRRTRGLTGARFFAMQPGAIRVGARPANAAYLYSLQSDDTAALYAWTQRLVRALSARRELADVSSDVQLGGAALNVRLDRDTGARLKITPQLIANTLYDAYGQRAASVIYNEMNQYRVVMEAAPRFWHDTQSLRQVWVSVAGGTAQGGIQANTIRARMSGTAGAASSQSALSFRNQIANSLVGGHGASSGSAVSTQAETMIPLVVAGTPSDGRTALAINHAGQGVATTISFNLPGGVSLGEAMAAVQDEVAKAGMPGSIHGTFAGNAAQLQKDSDNATILILASVIVVYMILGILYESFLHPLTILSTLPSAGVGALLALWACGESFSLMGMIGVILLIGIVKKNAIMLVDFAIAAERSEGCTPLQAIRAACLMRFRPIMMTSFAAAMGALPLVVGHGYGAEVRYPLGVTIIGGLIVSQALTLFTTPVVYLCMEQMRLFARDLVRLRPKQSPMF
ncbi:transport system membrane protein [Gluconacetobacter liquefaciens]|uniref:efflux RND transporter permease subunit n=1 Tax=Gluconacetobacter liquefaciens TaxID=89584 RepID=UPI00114392FF|nr:efflux RND transporter permease subunit [Gluconacetobacter liquefaciens]GBQ98009.1 multidrug efflux pump acriflavin resistance protein AcrB/AcrD/AcrF [Gluconacetobacter liquefaciens NRIC 0522]GEB35999.1 transport system membrane protein [Gluconacetobacter liquefaciens]